MMCSKFHEYSTILLTLFLFSDAVQLSSSWNLFSTVDTLPSNISLYNVSRVKRQNAVCGDDDYRCASGECIPLDQECDGAVNCQDGSDETDACKKIPCAAYLFTCSYGACINQDFECDGKQDCRDNSDELTPRCKRSSSCSVNEFQCKNGQCIDEADACDGTKNCADGSDETSEACLNINCPAFTYRCAYGGCVDATAKCNGIEECADGSDEVNCPNRPRPPPTPTPSPSPPPGRPGDCILPQHPENGEFIRQSEKQEAYFANTVVIQFTTLLLKCRSGYSPDSEYAVTVCSESQWMPPIKCVRTCPPLQSTDTLSVTCIYKNQEVPCDNPREGTLAEVKCKSFFEYKGTRPRMTCSGGSWDFPLVPCEPECGKKYVDVKTLVIGGQKAQVGEYPWLAGIYHSANRSHICGGSIISRYYVLSAAHCFTLDDGFRFSSSEYIVAAGKYYRNLDDTRDKNKEIRDIQHIYISDNYQGIVQNYGSDLAILKINEPFVLSQLVQPVCIDWQSKYENDAFKENNFGVVVGWGYTEERGVPADEIKKLVVPFRSKEVCKKFLPTEFSQRYYTYDKFCAGFVENRTSVCSGDSGGGLFFRNDERYYVRGIVSLAPRSNIGCDSNHFSLYTKLSPHIQYVDNVTGRKL